MHILLLVRINGICLLPQTVTIGLSEFCPDWQFYYAFYENVPRIAINYKFDVFCKCVKHALICILMSYLSPTQKYLSTYSTWSLTGLLFAIEAVRSTVLPLAALERKLTPREVVRLSRLEADYQVS